MGPPPHSAITLRGHPATAWAGAALANAGDGPLRLVCCLPVGGQGRLADGSSFVPPWAE